MAKSKFIFCVFLALHTLISAQDNFDGKITWSTPRELAKDEMRTYGGIGIINSEFYDIKLTKEKTFLQIYDLNSLSIKKEVEITKVYNKLEIVPSNYFIYEEKLMMVSTFTDKTANKINLFLHEINSDGSLGKTVDLPKFDLKTPIIVESEETEELRNSYKIAFNHLISEDKKQLMFYFKSENQNDSKSISISTILYNDKLEETARAEMILPFEYATIAQAKLSNSGVLHALVNDMTVNEDGKLKPKVYTTNEHYLFSLDSKHHLFNHIQLKIGKDISNSALKIFPDESVMVYGIFKNEDSDEANGTFFLKIDNELNVDFLTLDEFELDFLTKYMSEKLKEKVENREKDPNKKGYAGILKYNLHDLVVKENGDFVILAEQFRKYVVRIDPTSVFHHYIYGNIIASGCSSAGDLTSRQLITKYQHTMDDAGYNSSFFSMIRGNSIILIYSGKEAEMEGAEEKERKEYTPLSRKTVAGIVEISEDGEISKKILYSFEGAQVCNLAPKLCKKISNTEVFLFATSYEFTKFLGKLELP